MMLIQILFSRNPRALISRHSFYTLVMFIFSFKKNSSLENFEVDSGETTKSTHSTKNPLIYITQYKYFLLIMIISNMLFIV